MTYEKMTDMIDLDELEVQAEEIEEAAGFSYYSIIERRSPGAWWYNPLACD